jgi:inorganic pyrophosphatase
VLDQIAHFFTHYKDLEPEKWTRVGHWGGREDAIKVITEGLARAQREGF